LPQNFNPVQIKDLQFLSPINNIQRIIINNIPFGKIIAKLAQKFLAGKVQTFLP